MGTSRNLAQVLVAVGCLLVVLFGLRLSLRTALGEQGPGNLKFEFVRTEPDHSVYLQHRLRIRKTALKVVFRCSEEVSGSQLRDYLMVTRVPDGETCESSLEGQTEANLWAGRVFDGYAPFSGKAECMIVDGKRNVVGRGMVDLPGAKTYLTSSKQDPRLVAWYDGSAGIELQYVGKPMEGMELAAMVVNATHWYDKDGLTALPLRGGFAHFQIPFAADQREITVRIFGLKTLARSMAFDLNGLRLTHKSGQPQMELARTARFEIPGVGDYTVKPQAALIRQKSASQREVVLKATSNQSVRVSPEGFIMNFPVVEVVSPSLPHNGITALHFPFEARVPSGPLDGQPVREGEFGPVKLKIHYSVSQQKPLFTVTIPIANKAGTTSS
ncbi:MAG TPA: hypothetical protein VG944_17150 [Fimbriimonas sp.]|nr:hypothetical protein [Fimbriimonas sp.]